MAEAREDRYRTSGAAKLGEASLPLRTWVGAFAEKMLPTQQFDGWCKSIFIPVVKPLDLADLAMSPRFTRPLRSKANEFDVTRLTVRGADDGVEVAD
jgi:hypothetical protein